METFTRVTHNDEAFAAWVAAREAGNGRSFARFVLADRDYLVATGRGGEFAVHSDEDLVHDVSLATNCQLAANRARYADGHRYLNSRVGLRCSA